MYKHSVPPANSIHEANYMGPKIGHQHFTRFPMHHKDEIIVGTQYIENIVYLWKFKEKLN
jgi:hypothetical protein